MTKVYIFEQFLRDGLQSLQMCYAVHERIEMFNHLNACGFSGIEFGSTTNPSILPQMKGSFELWEYIKEHQKQNTKYTMLVPSINHLNKVIEVGIQSIGIIVSITDEFAYRNMRMSSEETFIQAQNIINQFSGIKSDTKKYIRIYLSQCFDGEIEKIRNYTSAFTEISYKKKEQNIEIEIVIADTVGICDVKSVRRVLGAIEDKSFIGVHLHINEDFEEIVDEVLSNKIYRFDTCIFGIGGCPYAKQLKGNLSTVPFIKYLHSKGYQTGIDIDKLEKAVEYLNSFYNI
jgi:hydroxymethylglutaryl-CoA lyase